MFNMPTLGKTEIEKENKKLKIINFKVMHKVWISVTQSIP